MTDSEKVSAIQKDVMDKIHGGSVHMKPRIYFTMLWLAGIVATITAGLIIAYLIGMLTYVIRIQNATTPAYGARENLSESIAAFPWWAVAVSVLMVAGAIWLMRKHSRIYRYSISMVLIVFMAVAFVLGIGMSYTDIGRLKSHGNDINTSEQRGNNGGSGRGGGNR